MIPVLLATVNTPLATELAVRSLLHYNDNIPLEIYVGDSSDTPETRSKIQSLVKEYHIYNQRTTHGYILTDLYKKINSPYFLTMDSDVEFYGPGLLQDMLNVLDTDPSAYVACGMINEQTWYHNLIAVWEWYEENGMFREQATPLLVQTRPHPYLSLWKRDQDLIEVLAAVTFETAAQMCSQPPATFWETGGLIATIMKLKHRTIKVISDRCYHYSSLSISGGKRYPAMITTLQERLQQYKRKLPKDRIKLL